MEFSPTQSEPDLTAKLRTVLRGLMAVFANWAVEPSLTPMIHNRISAIQRRIEGMLLRFRAGLLWRIPARAATTRRGGGKACRGPALPRKFGWLLIAGKHHAGYFHAQLQDLVNTPEMAELLAASPQAVRTLRPLCRALAVEMPGMAAATPRERMPRAPRKPRPKPEPFKIPLPRGVLTWARREKALENAKRRVR